MLLVIYMFIDAFIIIGNKTAIKRADVIIFDRTAQPKGCELLLDAKKRDKIDSEQKVMLKQIRVFLQFLYRPIFFQFDQILR